MAETDKKRKRTGEETELNKYLTVSIFCDYLQSNKKMTRASLAEKLKVTPNIAAFYLRQCNLNLYDTYACSDAKTAEKIKLLKQKHPEWAAYRLAREAGTYSLKAKRFLVKLGDEDNRL